mgnify:FL=1
MRHVCFLKLILLISFILSGCSSEGTNNISSDSYEKGEIVYKTLCISCHHIDPRKDGILAPAIAGSDYELIKSMIMTGRPPKGVKQKWPEAKMAPLPHLKESIPHLHDYIKTFK